MLRFFLTFFSLYAVGHAYVIWRLVRLPWIREHRLAPWLLVAMIIMGAGYPLARFFAGTPSVARAFEIIGADWMGVFFYLLLCFLAVDVLTLGGWLARGYAHQTRYFAAFAALGLSAWALIQGHRDPVVTRYEVTIPGLPKARDGFTLGMVSDLHLGTQFRGPWLDRLVDRINGLNTDAVVIVGDLIDRDARVVEPLTPNLARLKARHGVFSVAGNHEYYADEALSISIMRSAGFEVLRNEHREVLPGLTLAGVDDLTIASRNGPIDPLIEKATQDTAAGGVVLLSHSPLGHAKAESRGVGLMLSGHTHDGQIWPFRYFVKTRYPIVYGAEKVGQMTALVSRGAGGWGPRMRLPWPGEIVVITLRAP